MISVFLVIAIPLLITVTTQNVFDQNRERIGGFYKEEKNTIDVVFLGASDVASDFSSAFAYSKYNYTSYPFTVDANHFEFYKSQITEIYSYQNPKLVVVDMSTAPYIDENNDSARFDARLRKYTDYMPLSENKIQIVQQYGLKDHQLSYFFPFIMYHGQSLSIDSLRNQLDYNTKDHLLLKGVQGSLSNVEYKDSYVQSLNDKDIQRPSDYAINLVIDFIDFCDKNSYKIVFTRFPHRIDNGIGMKRYRIGNYFKEMILKKGYDYLDFESEKKIQLDYKLDFSNDEHLNFYGQQKFTKYLSEVLQKEYGIDKTVLSENDAKEWKESAEYIELFYEMYDRLKKGEKSELEIYRDDVWENKRLITLLNKSLYEK